MRDIVIPSIVKKLTNEEAFIHGFDAGRNYERELISLENSDIPSFAYPKKEKGGRYGR